MLEHLNAYRLDAMPADAQRLFFLTLSFAEIVPFVECYRGEPRVPDSFDESRFRTLHADRSPFAYKELPVRWFPARFDTLRHGSTGSPTGLRDRGNDVNVMLPLFTEDAAWDGDARFGVHAGKPAIREFLSQSGTFIGWTLHYMVSPDVVVAPDGQTATTFWYLWETANMPDRASGRAEAFWVGGTYDGEAVKLADGSWRFSRLALNLKLLSPYREGWAEKRLSD